jgi:hypothetical protein
MVEAIAYKIYHCSTNLKLMSPAPLKASSLSSFLKKSLHDSFRSVILPISFSSIEEPTLEDLQQQAIIWRFFSGSCLEQNYVLVPIEDPFFKKDEASQLFQERIEEESIFRLRDIFGQSIDPSSFHMIGSSLLILKDDTTFVDNKFYYESISQFITQSFNLREDAYRSIDRYQVVFDYEGIGAIAFGRDDVQKVDRAIFLWTLARAYLTALEAMTVGLADIMPEEQTSKINQLIKRYYHFLIRYYYSSPMHVNENKAYYIYSLIKETFKLKQQYEESKEKLRLLALLISNIHEN